MLLSVAIKFQLRKTSKKHGKIKCKVECFFPSLNCVLVSSLLPKIYQESLLYKCSFR